MNLQDLQKELQDLQKELQERIQDDFIDKLGEMVSNYLSKVIKRDYSMTPFELRVFEGIVKTITYIDNNCKR